MDVQYDKLKLICKEPKGSSHSFHVLCAYSIRNTFRITLTFNIKIYERSLNFCYNLPYLKNTINFFEIIKI